MSAPLRTALLGCGRIAGYFHLPILLGLEGVALAALAEPDERLRARASARAPGADAHADYRRVLADERIDAVVICLPSGLHAGAAEAAFAAGKHVFVEKPLAIDLAGADRVRQAWRASGTVGMVGFNQRFDPVVRGLRDAVRDGRLGEIVGARIVLGAAARSTPDWKRRRASGGGVLLDLGSHAADLARFLMAQEIRAVSATVMSARDEDDTAALVLILDDGRLIHVHLTSTAAQESRCELLGARGRLVADRYAGTLDLHPPLPPYGVRARARRALAGARRLPARSAALVRPPWDGRSHRALLAAFVAAARAGGDARPDLDDGHRSLATVLAAEESARTGRLVELGQDR